MNSWRHAGGVPLPPRPPSRNPSENSLEKPLVSERKIEANRRNALHSTGPRTPHGKRNVARNAIKHGLLAREVVITAGDGEENLEEFHTLLERLLDEYQPVGVLEETLVQRVATCSWRLARVLRAENGEIRKRLSEVKRERAEKLKSIHELLRKLRASRERNEQGKHSAFEKPNGESAGADSGSAVTVIDPQPELSKQPEQKNIGLDEEKLLSLSLPPEDATDKILRYEAHLDRQFYRAIDQLERLQRRRKGESVPPPLQHRLGREG